MPPASGNKGTSKKNAAAAMQKQSRNTTPAPAASIATASLPPQDFYDPDYLNTRVILFRNLSYDDLVDQTASLATVPDSKSLDGMIERLKSLHSIMEKRSTFYDRGMRYLADERKKRPSDDFDRGRADGEQEGKRPKHKRKKGSDTLAPQEGNIGKVPSCYHTYSILDTWLTLPPPAALNHTPADPLHIRSFKLTSVFRLRTFIPTERCEKSPKAFR